MSESKHLFGEQQSPAGASNGIERLGYSVVEAAAMLGLSPWSIRLAIKSKQIKVLRWGRRVIVPRQEIHRLIGLS